MWLGKKVEDDIFELSSTTIEVVLKESGYYEEKENYRFVGRDTPLFEVLNIFQKAQEEGNPIEAVVITHSGIKREKILGIITEWDLPEVQKILGLDLASK